MTPPFIIWTLRRTGSTTLAHALSRFCDGQAYYHEPFNRQRVYGAVTNSFVQSGDVARLEADLRAVLEERPFLKHCVDFLPLELHQTLARLTRDLGYREIVLDRRGEGARVFSLALANETTVWGAKQVAAGIAADAAPPEFQMDPRTIRKMIRKGRARRTNLVEMLSDRTPAPPLLFFEDLFATSDDDAERLTALCAHLDLGPEPESIAQALRAGLSQSKPQHSQKKRDRISNMDEIAPLLAAADAEQNPLEALPAL